jgi:hypothetical protein
VAIRPDHLPVRADGLIVVASQAPQTGIVMAAGSDSDDLVGRRVVFSRRRFDRPIMGIDRQSYVHDEIDGLLLISEDGVIAEVLGSGAQSETLRLLYGPVSIEDQVCLVWREGRWRPSPGWSLIENAAPKTELELPNHLKAGAGCGRIVDSGDHPDLPVGARIFFDTRPNSTLSMGLGSTSAQRLVRLSDIWMALE